MKKTAVLVLLLLLSSACYAQVTSIEQVRLLYQKSVTDEETCEKLIKLLKSYSAKDSLLLGYRGSAFMIMAKHVFNPFKNCLTLKKGETYFKKL